jgi:hypothetical protein
MKEKVQLTFSKKYSKLSNRVFTTIRWLDARYDLGRTYPVIYIVQNAFHTRQKLCHARIVKMEIVRVRDISDETIFKDADCSRSEFLTILETWYKLKPDWKGEDSEVQILTCEKVAVSGGYYTVNEAKKLCL